MIEIDIRKYINDITPIQPVVVKELIYASGLTLIAPREHLFINKGSDSRTIHNRRQAIKVGKVGTYLISKVPRKTHTEKSME